MKANWLSKSLCGLIIGVLTLFGTSASADTSAFALGDVLARPPGSFTGTRGWQFGHGGPNSSTEDIIITQLGVFDNAGDGLVNSHQIGLWIADNVSGMLLASAVVPAGTDALLEGGYRWVPIIPVRIPYASGSLVLAAQYSAGDADDLVTPRPFSLHSQFQFAPDISVFTGGGRAGSGNDLPYPAAWSSCGEGCVPEIFWEPNFQYVVVPEPSVWLLLSPALLYLILRHRRTALGPSGRQ